MNIKYYFFDKEVISLLYSLSDDNEIMNNLQYLQEMIVRVFPAIVEDYLGMKGIDEQKVKVFLSINSDMKPDQDLSNMLETEEFTNYMEEQVNEFNKLIINTQMEKLSDEEKTTLVKYLLSKQEEIANQKNIETNFIKNIVTLRKRVQEENLSNEELDQLVSIMATDMMAGKETLQDGENTNIQIQS